MLYRVCSKSRRSEFHGIDLNPRDQLHVDDQPRTHLLFLDIRNNCRKAKLRAILATREADRLELRYRKQKELLEAYNTPIEERAQELKDELKA